MNNHTQSEKLDLLFKALRLLPGGETFDLVSKKYPRASDLDLQATYTEQVQRFSMTDLSRITLQRDVDDFKVILRGKRTVIGTKENPAQAVSEVLYSAGISADWGCREHNGSAHSHNSDFAVELFPDSGNCCLSES